MAASGDDVAVLERVLHRLVMTPDDKLSEVLDKLLPRLVAKLNDKNDPTMRQKTVEVLSHVSKRVRPNTAIQLPCAELLAVYKSVLPGSFSFNFALVYLEMGLPRTSPADRPALSIGLMRGISRLPRHGAQQNAVLNLLLACLDAVPLSLRPSPPSAMLGTAATSGRAAGAPAPLQTIQSVSGRAVAATAAAAADTGAEAPLSPADVAEVADFLLDLAIYPGPLTRECSVYHGLSAAGLARLTLKEKAWPRALLTARKLQALRALRSDLFPAAPLVPVALTAACDTHHEVIKSAEDLLKSLAAAERGGAMTDDAALAATLFGLVLGGSGGRVGCDDGAAGRPPESRAPASAALTVRAVSWLLSECPGGVIARVPDAVRAVFHCLVAPNEELAGDRASFSRMRASGAALAAFVAGRVDPNLLPLVGPLLLQAVQRVLLANRDGGGGGGGAGDGGGSSNGGGSGGGGNASDSGGGSLVMQAQHAAMLEGCYETIAALARESSLFSQDASVPALLFQDMSAREPGLRIRISAALGALKSVYRSPAGVGSGRGGGGGVPTGALAAELWMLLWSAASSGEHRARLCAVEWASELFPFCDVRARRLCLALSNDPVTAVRNAAERALSPRAAGPARSAVTAIIVAEAKGSVLGEERVDTAVTAAAGSNAADEREVYPDPADFILGALAAGADKPLGASGALVDLPPAALARTVDFARKCIREAAPNYFVSAGLEGVVDLRSNGSIATSAATASNRRAFALRELLARLESVLSAAPSATDPAHGHAQTVRLHCAAAACLRDVLGTFMPAAAAAFAERGPWLQAWLAHEGSTEIREAFAEVAGSVAPRMPEQQHLVPFLRALGLKVRACTGDGGSGSNRAVAAAHGALCAIGAVVAALAPKTAAAGAAPTTAVTPAAAATEAGLWASLLPDVLPRAVSAVASAVGQPISLLHLAACGALSRIGAVTPLPLPSGPPEPLAVVTVPGGAGVTMLQETFEALWSCCRLGETTDSGRRCEAAADALGKLCLGIGNGEGAESSPPAMVRNASTSTAAAAAPAAAPAGGEIGLVEASRLRLRTLEALFGMSRHLKEEELQFAAAEAACDVAHSGRILVAADDVRPLEAAIAAAQRTLATLRWLPKERESAPAAAAEASIDATASMDIDEAGAAIPAVLPASAGATATAAGADLDLATMDAMELVCCRVLYVLLEDHSPHVSGAAAVYLIALARCGGGGCGGGDAADVLKLYLTDIQAAFTRLLTARSEFVQEVASRGLALVYEAAGDDARRGLVDSLVQALSTGQRAKAATGSGVDVHGVSHAGAALSSAGANAYSEMCAVANDVGRPDLIYSFLSLASHHAAWTTRRGAGYGLAAIFATAGTALRPHLAQLVPRLYRYRHDPSAQTRQAMQQLWDAVVGSAAGGGGAIDGACAGGGGGAGGGGPASSADVVHTYFPVIAEELLRAAGERRWRERQGAASALGSLLQGRSFAELSPFLLRMWDACDRLLDDIKESVVEAAAEFAKALTAVSVRLCDPESTAWIPEAVSNSSGAPSAQNNAGAAGTAPATESAASTAAAAAAAAETARPPLSTGATARLQRATDAREAVATLLPWLLHKGLLSRCKASQTLSLVTLQRMVKAADGSALRPHLALLVATLVEALSALEPAALQYMQFHAESQLDMTQESMERLRLSLARAGPLQEALDCCYKHIDGAAAEDLMPRLMALLRSGVGLATRSASAFLVLTLCEKTPRQVRDASNRLLPTLTNAALSERSAALRSTYASAVAAVARLAPPARATHLVRQLCKLFRESDPALDARQRRVAAVLLHDVCLRAGSALAPPMTAATAAATAAAWGGSSGGGWAAALPLAFVARHDPEEAVAAAFSGAWAEGLMQMQLGAVPTGDVAVRNAKDALGLMLPEVFAEVAAALQNPSRISRRQGCTAAKDIAVIMSSGSGGSGDFGSRPEARRLLRLLMAMVPGRVWEGKDVLLGAVVAVAVACKPKGITLDGGNSDGDGDGAGAATDAADDADGADENDGGGEGRDAKRSRVADADSAGDNNDDEGHDHGNGAADAAAVLYAAAVGEEGIAAMVVTTNDATAPEKAGAANLVEPLPAAAVPEASEDDYTYQEKITDGDATAAEPDRARLAALVIGGGGVTAAAATSSGADTMDVKGSDAATAAASLAALTTAAGTAPTEPMAVGDRESVDLGPVSYIVLVRLLRQQLLRRNKVFRRAAAGGLAELVAAFPKRCVLAELLAPLLELARLGSPSEAGDDPILEAKAVACIAAAWPQLSSVPSLATAMTAAAAGTSGASSSGSGWSSGGGGGGGGGGDSSEAEEEAWMAAYAVQLEHTAEVVRAARGAVSRKVWSVRVALLKLLAAVAQRSFAPPADAAAGIGAGAANAAAGAAGPPSPLTGTVIDDLVVAAAAGAEDLKYSQVRAAALLVLGAAAARPELRVALMPHKEEVQQLAAAAAADVDPAVATSAARLRNALAWWP